MPAGPAELYAGHQWALRVYYEDTDAGGVVYYANYLKFMERARTEWLRTLGFEQDRLRQELGLQFVVHEIAVKFRQPARFNDRLLVDSRVAEAGRVRLVFNQDLLLDTDERPLVCSGRVTVVCVQAQSFRPRAIPKSIILELTGEC
jgi:acyl-CoA thioester hydrolase